MTENELRARVVEQAQRWLGFSESDGRHREIIDLYNSYTPHPRGVAMDYQMPWCATFVSAVAIACGVDDIMPVECSCPVMITLYQRLGCWMEDDGYAGVKPGDVLFYDWQDDGRDENTGTPDHVGLVESVNGSTIVVIEGNCSNKVARRSLQINGRYIRGYGVPDYAGIAETADAWVTPEKPVTPPTSQTVGGDTMAKCTAKLPQLSVGCTGLSVKALQTLLVFRGCRLPKYGVDGDFGEETKQAVMTLQAAGKITVDGVVGAQTWPVVVGG